MNASSWRQAVDLIAQGTQAIQQIQAATTADSNQLESLPISALAAYDSSPPQVKYGSEQPLEIDLCNFPAIWAVLSVLLNTMSSDLHYV